MKIARPSLEEFADDARVMLALRRDQRAQLARADRSSRQRQGHVEPEARLMLLPAMFEPVTIIAELSGPAA